MSEILDSTVSPSGETAEHYDKHAFAENVKTNPLEYFQHSKQRHYFTSLNTGYCISSKSEDKKCADAEKKEKKIYMFSRRTVHKRVHLILKRKIIGEMGKLAKSKKSKLKHHIPNTIEIHFRKGELANKIVKIKNRLVHSLPAKLNANIKKPLKMSITLTKSSEQSNKDGKKPHRKLMRIMFSTSPLLKEMYNKYITFIEPYSELERSDSNKCQGSANFASTDYRSPSYLLSSGTNPEYPIELNELLKPNKCDLCNVDMNSFQTEHRHYNSSVHKKRVNNWLYFMYDKGMEGQGFQGFIGADPIEYFCHVCTIKLLSSRHALQHYNGRRHRALVLKRTQLKGIGYFDLEGEWIETGKVVDESTGKEIPHVFITTLTGVEMVPLYDASKLNSQSKTEETSLNIPVITIEDSDEEEASNNEIPQTVEQENSEETGISKEENISSDEKDIFQFEQFSPEFYNAQNIENTYSWTTTMDDPSLSMYQYWPGIDIYNTTDNTLPQIQTFSQALAELSCSLCNIKTTSRKQMLCHLKGSRHMKKMKLLGDTQPFVTIAESLELHDPEDLSIFRTPSGSYYCDMCKVAATEPQHMKNHISLYSHRKMQRQRNMALKS